MYTLITAAASARAYQLKARLGNENVLMGDYQDLPEVMVKSGRLLKLPLPQSASYAHQMLTLCLDLQVEQVYALHADEVTLLREAEQLFGEYGIQLNYYPDEL